MARATHSLRFLFMMRYTYRANLIWSFRVTNWRPRDRRYSRRLPLDMYSVTIFREDLSKMMPLRHTKFSCCKDLENITMRCTCWNIDKNCDLEYNHSSSSHSVWTQIFTTEKIETSNTMISNYATRKIDFLKRKIRTYVITVASAKNCFVRCGCMSFITLMATFWAW